MAWTTGQKLHHGNYTIEKELGRKGFGITYLAKDQQDQALVIKTLNEDKLNQLTISDRDSLKCKFVDEARKLESCNPLHMARVQGTFIEGQLFCIALEYIQGDTLASLAQRSLSEQEVLGYIQQVGEALMEVHDHGLLHQDIKPDHIVVRRDRDEAILINFDLATDFDHPLMFRWQDQSFVPLERNCGQMTLGACTDIYALAATLYVILTGHFPATALERKEGNVQLIPPKQINPHISRRVNSAILKGMSLEPDSRPQSMEEWLDLLGLNPNRSHFGLLGSQPQWAVILEILGVVGVLAGVISGTINVMNLWENNNPAPPSHEVISHPDD